MSYWYTIPREQYMLYHHGILGQKWGIRRFQPYGHGEKVKGGKEIGKAARVKQRENNETKTYSRSSVGGKREAVRAATQLTSSEKNYKRGETRLQKRLEKTARKSDRATAGLMGDTSTKAIRMQEINEQTRKILNDPARVERIGRITRKRRVIGATLSTLSGFIATGSLTLLAMPFPEAVISGAAVALGNNFLNYLRLRS